MDKKALPVIPPDRLDDLHGLDIVDRADLVLFVAGNQFMVMDELLKAFKKRCPEVEHIFYETLPPGLELKQILAGGALFRGRVLAVYPDVYASVSSEAMKTLRQKRHLGSQRPVCYLHNRLSLMVPEGNPAGIRTVMDLAGRNIRISQPDPRNEDIAFHIMEMYRQAGGEDLVHRIMEEKRAEGTTLYTIVHHRETPLRINRLTVDVGPVWATEIRHARSTGMRFDVVEPGEALDQRHRIRYYISRLENGANPDNAQKFIDFIVTPAAQGIYKRHGFMSCLDIEEDAMGREST